MVTAVGRWSSEDMAAVTPQHPRSCFKGVASMLAVLKSGLAGDSDLLQQPFLSSLYLLSNPF